MITLIELILAALLALFIIESFPEPPAVPPPIQCGRQFVCG